MSRTARALVDGLGVQRVVARMRAATITLRRVRDEDSRLVWEWANDPEVSSFFLLRSHPVGNTC